MISRRLPSAVVCSASADQLDAADLEAERQPVAEHLVVVAWDIQHLGAIAGVAQHQLDHLIVHAVPVPGFAQTPAVHDVADQEQILATEGAEKMGQEIASAAACPEMRVGDEDTAVSGLVRG